MKTIKRYLDEAKRKYQLRRDAELSQKLGVPPNHISHWYSGVSEPNDEAAVKLALILNVNPLEIIACANYYRTLKSRKRQRNPRRNAAQRRFWRQVYNQAVRKR